MEKSKSKGIFSGFSFRKLGQTLGKVFSRPTVELKIQKVSPPSLPDNLPTSRVSDPDLGLNTLVQNLGPQYKVVNYDFVVEIIDIIRNLVKFNPDLSQALNNVVTLGNTGHKVFFDRSVPQEQVDKMRRRLNQRSKSWATGVAGMDGLVNKMISQLIISGALSNEWVPENDLSGIKNCTLVKPDSIRYVLADDKTTYLPYQLLKNTLSASVKDTMIPLNPETYKYFGMNGDTEIPYGFPSYMPALPRIVAQQNMEKNIDFIVDTMGLIGFLEFLMDKPEQNTGESDAQFSSRLDNLLGQAKTRISQGFKDGVVAGFRGDHEFKFNSAGSRDLSSLLNIFKNNEQQIFSAIKSDPTLAGRDYNTSETQITVIFMKMLSELKNIQNIVKHNLEFGYSLDLRLAGFKFEYLTVQFNRSTIQDDLKYQQAEEIKIRNVISKYVLGVISHEQVTDELGYEDSAEGKPLVPVEMLAGGKSPDEQAKSGEKDKNTKNKSAKKTRDTNKPISKDK